MKKILAVALVILLVLVGIDLFIRQPWKDDNVVIVNEPTIDSEHEEEDQDKTDENVEGEPAEENTGELEEEQPLEGDIEIDRFYNDSNDYRDLYLNNEFSEEVYKRYKGVELDEEGLINLKTIMEDVFRVSQGMIEEETLYGRVDSVNLEYNRPRYNGVIKMLSERDNYLITSTMKISENVYAFSFIASSASGDAIEGHEDDTFSTWATYNKELNRISFEELIQRKPIEITFEDERFLLEAFMVQTTTMDSSIYAAISTLIAEEVYDHEFPDIAAKITDRRGDEIWVPLSISSGPGILHKNITAFYKLDTPVLINDVLEISISKR